ncbi:IclR family transcriptional regulator [Acidithiobacillus sp.]|uniref:IclR family transcriptional regulator n=1 Tax=Acidithiobacillus sp. TaxID=1872118 RepID=UPI0025C0BC7F|nr:IclR family transcriptional regulator [Acidithiobacillus sp.]
MTGFRKQAQSGIQVIDRLRALLEALAAAGGEANLKTLTADTGLATSTAFRILAAAEANGMILRDPQGRYAFAPRLADWAELIAGRNDLCTLARPSMIWLRDQIRETVNLSIQEQDEVLYVDRATPSRMMRVEQIIGSRAPLHCTAVGKLMLARQDPAAVAAYAQRSGLRALTRHSIVSLESLQQELARIRSQGYALDNEETEEGVGCIGVLIEADLPWIVGLSISAPMERRELSWVKSLHEAARRILRSLRGRKVTLNVHYPESPTATHL